MERRKMKVGMEVKVMPATRRSRRGNTISGRLATLLEVPTENRGRARVRFVAGGTARVPIGRLIKVDARQPFWYA